MPRDARKPLSLPVLNILLALADGAKHGYAIKQDVEERSEGAIRLGPGTLYEAIQRLEDDGLIAEDAPGRTGQRTGGAAPRLQAHRSGLVGLCGARSVSSEAWSIAHAPIRGCARASRDGHLQAAFVSLSAAVQTALSAPSSRPLSGPTAFRLRQTGLAGALRFWAYILGDLIVTASRLRLRSGSRRLRRRARLPVPPPEVSNGHPASGHSLRAPLVRAPSRLHGGRGRCRSPSASAATASSTGWWTGSSCARSRIRTPIGWLRSA